jgi:hypothetical protein
MAGSFPDDRVGLALADVRATIRLDLLRPSG